MKWGEKGKNWKNLKLNSKPDAAEGRVRFSSKNRSLASFSGGCVDFLFLAHATFTSMRPSLERKFGYNNFQLMETNTIIGQNRAGSWSESKVGFLRRVTSEKREFETFRFFSSDKMLRDILSAFGRFVIQIQILKIELFSKIISLILAY